MERRRRQQIERLYHAASARPIGERAAFLEEACAGDEALRRDVNALLDTPTASEATLTLEPAAWMASNQKTHVLSGSRLGVYHLQERIGAGGMGVVYRAHDTRLGRQVAIKILPPVVADDPARRARFEREAQLLASLNHPNIATIYGFEESTAIGALVMELVEGETLAERIARSGATDTASPSVDGTGIPMDEALALAQQIAEALEAAHQKNIVHRDLKPANIKITPAARVKVLDFGLAKALADQEPEMDANHIGALVDVSRDGLIRGTAAYMSPEQSQGQSLDTRADVWAFGCVMYEMLTGRSAFARTTIDETLAALCTEEPDWGALPAATPTSIRRVLEQCLAKDARDRLSDIRGVVIEIDSLRREAARQDDLRLRHDRSRALKQPTASSDAYQHYLRGRHHWFKRTALGFTRAIECFELAIQADPGFALAHAGIADCYAVLSFYDAGPTIQFHQRAKQAAATALALDDTLAEAHVSLGHVLLNYDWDWPAAEKELQIGIALAPSSSEAHHVYANYLSTIGRMEDSIQALRRSLECDPVSLPVNAGLGVTLYFARRYDEAARQLLKTLELDEHYAPAYAFLGWTHCERGLNAEAIAASEKALTLMDAPWILVTVGLAYARAGRKNDAQQVLTSLLERAKNEYVSPYDLAVMNAALGERERALAHLEAAYRERASTLVWGLLQDPRLDSLRQEAMFTDLLRRVGLDAQDQRR